MKKINVIGGLILLALTYQNAQAAPTKPNKCPSVSAIIARGIDIATFKEHGWGIDVWQAGVLSEQYDTNTAFTFAIGDIQAKDADSAKTFAITALKTLTFTEGPIFDELTKSWICKYNTVKGYQAEAWTSQRN